MNKKFFLLIIASIVIVLLAIAALIFDFGRKDYSVVDFTKISTTTNASLKAEMPIEISYPIDNQEVKNPIKIKGKARGNWFFEGTFPIQLVDSTGEIIATGTAIAVDNWMTEDFVNFVSVINYDKTTSMDRGLIVLSKDNPSDNPEFDQSIFIPVILK